MKGIKGGFLPMLISILGLVLFVSMFSSIMTQIVDLYDNASTSTFTALQTILAISPTMLLLVGTALAGWGYKKGLSGVAASDANGLIRIVFGILMIILFLTLFDTIITNFGTLYTAYGSCTTFIAYGTVLAIMPTILFLGGLFAGGATSYSGYRARRRRRALA